MKRPLIDVINVIGTFIVVCVISFAVYMLFVDKPFYRLESYSGFRGGSDETTIGANDESGTYSTEHPADRVEVGNVSGAIEIEGWNRNFVRLDYFKRGPGRHPEVRIDENGSSVVIKAIYPKAPGNFGSVDFFLKVPENLEYLEAKSISGRVIVEGLGSEVKQKLSSTSGTVKTDGSGDLEISSVSGQLDFTTSGNRISASTTSGRIEGKLEKNPVSGKIEISSVSGRVVLEVPSNLNADVDFHSVSGSVNTELPVSVTETKRNTIRGVVGNGGNVLDVSTVSGSIKINK